MQRQEVITKRSFPSIPALRSLITGLLFVAAFALRIYQIDKPPMDFSAVRQYHGALIARGLYEWLLTGNMKTVPPDGFIEPPVLDLVVSFAYLIFGGEHLWIPRLLSTLFWIIGGIFLYLIAKRIVSPNAAVFAVLFYLFDPAIVLPSRAFMPDPLMIMSLLISVFTILRYHEEPSPHRLVVAAVASSLAIFVKPGICFFQILGAFVALAVYRRGLVRSLTNVQFLLFAVLSLLPTGLYYYYGTVIEGFLRRQAQEKFAPELLLEWHFWMGWLRQIEIMVGLVAFTGALVGVLLFSTGRSRALMIGLWSGYFLFGLAFAPHVHTHDYYSLQLVPVVALSLGLVGDLTVGYLRQLNLHYHGQAIIAGLLTLLVFLSVGGASDDYALGIVRQTQGKDFPGTYEGSHTLIADYDGRAKTYREIGNVVGHSPDTLFWAPDWGHPLMYHGRLNGKYWPWYGKWSEHSAKVHFEELRTELSPDYFIVIKRFTHYGVLVAWADKENEPLRHFLTNNFPVVAEDSDYIVFDLRNDRHTSDAKAPR